MAKMNFLPAVTAENYFDPDIEMAYMEIGRASCRERVSA